MSTTSSADISQLVIADYRAFWVAYLAAADPMDPTSSELEEHAIGNELEQLQTAFTRHFERGEVIRGTVDLAPKVVSVGRSTATISDCYGDSTQVVAANGATDDPAGETRFQVTVTLELAGGTWKVSAITMEGEGCTPA